MVNSREFLLAKNSLTTRIDMDDLQRDLEQNLFHDAAGLKLNVLTPKPRFPNIDDAGSG
jgi:hypothetical protein